MPVYPRPMTVREAIVSTWRLPAPVQETFLRFPHLLAANQYLTEDVWYRLWETEHTALSEAVKLVTRSLTDSQIRTVLASETRYEVLGNMFEENSTSITPGQTVAMVRDCDAPAILARQVLGFRSLETKTIRLLADYLDSEHRLEVVVDPEFGYTPDQVLDLVEEFPSVGRITSNISMRLRMFLEDNHEAVTQRPYLPVRMREIVIRSRFATSDTQQRLLGVSHPDSLVEWQSVAPLFAEAMCNNPLCTPDTAEWFTKHPIDAVRRAAQRRLGAGSVLDVTTADLVKHPEVVVWAGHVTTTTFDTLAVLSNPTITLGQAQTLLNSLTSRMRNSRRAAVGKERFTRVTTGLARRLPALADVVSAPVWWTASTRAFWREDMYKFCPAYESPADALNGLDVAELPTQNMWTAPNAAADLVTDLLGDNAGEWEMFLGLAEHHTGRLGECAKAAQRLLIYH